MATRSSKGRVPYNVLHNLSSVDVLYDEKWQKPSPRTVGVFEAERLIARRKDEKVNGNSILIKLISLTDSVLYYLLIHFST